MAKPNNQKLVLETPRGRMIQVKSKNGTMKVKLEFNPMYAPKMMQTLQSVQTAFSLECLRLCDKYTYKDTGMLIASAQISSKPEEGELKWNTPYAAALYYSKRNPGTQTGALRGPYWGERMKADNLTHLKAFVKSRVGEGMK